MLPIGFYDSPCRHFFRSTFRTGKALDDPTQELVRRISTPEPECIQIPGARTAETAGAHSVLGAEISDTHLIEGSNENIFYHTARHTFQLDQEMPIPQVANTRRL